MGEQLSGLPRDRTRNENSENNSNGVSESNNFERSETRTSFADNGEVQRDRRTDSTVDVSENTERLGG